MLNVEFCIKNIRCDKAGCHSLATYAINTSGYKGCVCLCESCFNELCQSIEKIRSITKEQEIKPRPVKPKTKPQP